MRTTAAPTMKTILSSRCTVWEEFENLHYVEELETEITAKNLH